MPLFAFVLLFEVKCEAADGWRRQWRGIKSAGIRWHCSKEVQLHGTSNLNKILNS